MKGENWYADRMNSLPKYVFSSTLDKGQWNATIIKGDLAEEVTKLKQQPGENMLIFGSGKLVNGLLRHGLLDELRLMVHPVVLAHGRRLFEEDALIALKIGAKAFDSGVVLLVYQPSGDEA